MALARKLAVILHRMLADRKPFAFAALRRNRRRSRVFGQVLDTSLPEAKSPRRDDGLGQTAPAPVGLRPRKRRLADLILMDTIRWQPRARCGPALTPYRSECPARQDVVNRD